MRTVSTHSSFFLLLLLFFSICSMIILLSHLYSWARFHGDDFVTLIFLTQHWFMFFYHHGFVIAVQ